MLQFSTRDELDAWLENKPDEVSQAIAWRAAMRVVPVLTLQAPEKMARETLALAALRALLTVIVSIALPHADLKIKARVAGNEVSAERSKATDRSIRPMKATALLNAADAIIAVSAHILDLPNSRSLKGSAAVRSAAKAIELAIDSAQTEIAQGSEVWVAASADALLDQSTLPSAPIWMPDALVDVFASWKASLQILIYQGHPWIFWGEWYDRAMAGDPLPWDLQEQIALIPDEIWEAGPEAVADEIKDIRARYDVTEAARATESYFAEPVDGAVSAANPMMGHNRPPPEEQLPMAPPELDQLLVSVQTIQVLAQAPQLDVPALQAEAERVEAAQKSIGVWLAEKCDKSADEFFKEFGKWGGRVAIAGLTTSALWFLGLLEKIGPLLSSLGNLIRLGIGI